MVTAPGPNRLAARLMAVRDLGPTRLCHIEIEGQAATITIPRDRGLPADETILVEFPRAKALPYSDGLPAGAG